MQNLRQVSRMHRHISRHNVVMATHFVDLLPSIAVALLPPPPGTLRPKLSSRTLRPKESLNHVYAYAYVVVDTIIRTDGQDMGSSWTVYSWYPSLHGYICALLDTKLVSA